MKIKKIVALLTAACLCIGSPMTTLASPTEDPAAQITTEQTNEVQPAAESDVKTRTMYLSDTDWKSETHGDSAPIQKDKNYGGTKIRLMVDGEVKEIAKGIGTQTDSTIIYNMDGKGYTRFETLLGVDYETIKDIVAEKCDVKFTISIDGTDVVTTDVLDPSKDAVKVDIPIPDGAKELVLKAEKVTENWSDWAIYGDAKFTQIMPEPKNVAVGKEVSLLKTADDTEAPFNPDSLVSKEKAVDGIVDTNSYFDFGDQAPSGGVRQSIYMQVDLKGSFLLSGINMWRYWLDSRKYDATVIAVSNDSKFETKEIIFNSDAENIHGLGAGTDELYAESAEGKAFTIPDGTKARYIRVYTYGVKNSGVTNHIVELKVNAYVFGDEIPEAPAEEKVFPNAENPLQLEGPGTDGQVTHPDVVVLKDGWKGYKYWMGYTPNKPGSSYYENPCIAASKDGVTWVFPATNPVQPRFDSEIPNENEHNCDTDLVYDPVNDRMILYWEWANDIGASFSEIRYRISYDGVNWGMPDENGTIITGPQDYGVAIRSDGAKYSDLSPTVLYDKNEKIYKMWANDAGDIGYNNKERNKVWYRTSADGLTNWSDKQYVNNWLGVNEEGKQLYPWHQDVQWIDEFQEYWALQQAFPQGSGPDNSSLRWAKSKDGINWEPVSEKALITVGAPGTWDAGQIYRSTFWYEPGAAGSEQKGTFHIWYAALATGQSHWDIGYTSAPYMDVMEKLTGKRPAAEKRMIIDNENPLLVMPLYGKSYDPNGSVLDWGDTLVDRWKAVPDDLKKNSVIELHVGGKIGLNEYDSATTKAFYEQQLEIAQANNIPVFVVVATAGLKNYYTGTANLDAAWADAMFKKYSVLKGIMSTENYWTDYNAVANIGSEYLEVAYENGGYFMWSEHQEGVIENVVANPKFNKALNRFGDNFIFTWKNTPANTNSNAGTASYMQGLWLTGICGQWGGLADTWKWYEKGFWKLFGGRKGYNPGGEEARPVATQPEALLGIEMMSIYTNGGCVYNFEHPAYVYGSYNQNSPAYVNVIEEFIRYAIANPAPTKEEVLADTKVAFYGSLSALKNSNKLLQKDIGWQDATLPTQVSGRYGLIPAVPPAVSQERVDSVFSGIPVINQDSEELATTESKVAYFNDKYEEKYTGTAFGQLVKGVWYLYNSNVNVEGDQNAKMTLGTKTADVTMTPHTYVILQEKDGKLDFKLNNYRVNKDSIWEGYGDTVLDRWDTDHNTKLQDWVRDTYIPTPDDDTMRTTTIKLTGLLAKPTVQVTRGLKDQYNEPVVSYNETSGEGTVTIQSNGYVDFTITDVADKTELKNKLDQAKTYKAENYSPESFKTLTDIITAAQLVFDNANAAQKDITAAITKLENAIKALAVNKTTLQTQLNQAKAYKAPEYTAASFQALTTAITEAQKVFDNASATQKDVDAAVAKLASAIKGLVKDTGKTIAEAVIKQINAIGTVTLSKETTIQNARKSYDALTSAQKALVTNYATLQSAEQKVAELKFAANKITVKAANSGMSIKLTWNKVSGASGYEVLLKSGSTWKKVATLKSSATSYVYSKGKAGTSCTFQVKAYKNVNSKKAYSVSKGVSKKVVVPTTAVTGTTTTKSIKLSWKKISGVDGYEVLVKSGSKWKVLTQTKSTSYQYKKVSAGKNYTFAVKAYKKNGSKKVYGSYKAIQKKAVPATPKITAKAAKGSITIQWKKQSEANGYKIMRKDGSKWKTVATVSSKTLKYTDKKVSKGKKYTYRIQSYKTNKSAKIYSSNSNEMKVSAK